MNILLVHGLGRTPLSMGLLGHYLQQYGHRIHYFGYIAFAESYDCIVTRLRDRIATITNRLNHPDLGIVSGPDANATRTTSATHKVGQTSSQFPYGIVAHSLGGLLVRSALAPEIYSTNSHQNSPQHEQETTTSIPKMSLIPPALLVMLGTPNQSPRAARLAWKLWPFQWFSGQCGANLASFQFFDTLPQPCFPYQIIAGTGGWYGLGSPFGSEQNDGLVALSETRISDRDSVLQFPVFHTFMMNSKAVQEAIAQALTSVEL